MRPKEWRAEYSASPFNFLRFFVVGALIEGRPRTKSPIVDGTFCLRKTKHKINGGQKVSPGKNKRRDVIFFRPPEQARDF
ncbi:MAG: hypothetical protein QMD08_08355 [Actinomycetota bacterium]|nr:hypothetical protein [Actinomycetota bacterium]